MFTRLYRIQVTHIRFDDQHQVIVLPATYPDVHTANMEARDLAEIEYCIPSIETGRCTRGADGGPQEWVVCNVGDESSVRIVIRVIAT
jgi:hypothetical protein